MWVWVAPCRESCSEVQEGHSWLLLALLCFSNRVEREGLEVWLKDRWAPRCSLLEVQQRHLFSRSDPHPDARA